MAGFVSDCEQLLRKLLDTTSLSEREARFFVALELGDSKDDVVYDEDVEQCPRAGTLTPATHSYPARRAERRESCE